MKKINKKTLTNKQLRRLFKRAKDFAQKCNQGDTIMCPCGCMRLFAKKTKKSIFFEQKNNQCKNNYYSRIRSESNYDFDSQKKIVFSIMNSYVCKKKVELASKYKKI